MSRVPSVEVFERTGEAGEQLLSPRVTSCAKATPFLSHKGGGDENMRDSSLAVPESRLSHIPWDCQHCCQGQGWAAQG